MFAQNTMLHASNVARGLVMPNAVGLGGESASCGINGSGEGGHLNQARRASVGDGTDYDYSPNSIYGTDAAFHRQQQQQQERQVRGHVSFESHSPCAYDSEEEHDYKEEDEDDSFYFNQSHEGLNDDDGTTGLRVPCREDVVARLNGMLKGETRMVAPRADYIEVVQSGGMSSMWRTRICEWLLEFVDEFDLTVDTIAVAVFNIDRYMSFRQVEGCIVQLVAMAAIMVASKVHEPCPLQVNDVQWLAEGVYCESDIRLMELDLLHTIGWDANPVTSYQFMRHLSLLHPDFRHLHAILQPIHLQNSNDTIRTTSNTTAIHYDTRMRISDDAVGLHGDFEARCMRAEWFLDLAMSDYAYLEYPQSVQAHAAVVCVLTTQGMDPEPWAASVCAALGANAIDLDAARLCADSMMEVYQQQFSLALERNRTDRHQGDGINNNRTGVRTSISSSCSSSTSSTEEQQHALLANPIGSNSTHVREDLRLVHCDDNGVLGAGDEAELYAEKAMRQLEVTSPDCVADLLSPDSESSKWSFMSNNKAVMRYGDNGNDGNKTVLHYDNSTGNSNELCARMVVRGGENVKLSTLVTDVPAAVRTSTACSSSEEDDELVSSIEKQFRIGSPVHIWDARASFISSSPTPAPADVPTLSSSGTMD